MIALKNGTIYFKGELVKKDILIDGKTIKKIGDDLNADRVIDCEGKTILPGIIDVHVHAREPGAVHKEDYLSISKAAAAGGVTTIFDMPNNPIPTISQEAVDEKIKLAKKSLVNYGIYIGATKENLTTLNNIKNVVGIKVYRGSSTGNLLLDSIADFAYLMENTNKLVVVHSENEDLIKYFSERFGHTKMHHLMRDNLAAAISTGSSVQTANYYAKRLHIAHMSTKEEVEIMRKFKTPNITCEVTPQHLNLNSEFFMKKGNYGKMNPPLRSEEDRKALWDAIKEGIVDLIATDHAPHTTKEKDQDFDHGPCGLPGVQTSLPLMLNAVNNNIISIHDIVRLMVTNPAKLYGIKNRSEIKEGNFADLAIIDMKASFTIKNEDQHSKCGWTPFHDQKVTGKPVMTLVNGNIVFNNGGFNEQFKGEHIEL